MKIYIDHYVNKVSVIDFIEDLKEPKIEIKQKSVIITDNEQIVFCCKMSDFISCVCGNSLGIQNRKIESEEK